MEQYRDRGPFDVEAKPDLSRLAGKSVVVTGGANGMGEEYIKAFTAAGAYCTIADIADEDANRIVKEIGKNVQFIHCDVRSWADQLKVFKQAIANSPSKSVDIVIANAGISGADTVFWDDKTEDPVEPNLSILNINLVGVLYTIKLALHYFRRQHEKNPQDVNQVLIMQGSLAGYIDLPGSMQYASSKYALRGMMRNLRRSAWTFGTRVNYIAPWFIKTKILSQATVDKLTAGGVVFAEAEDAAHAAIRLCADPNATGRSLAVVPREEDPSGILDLNIDDFPEDSKLQGWQMRALRSSARDLVPPDQQ